jgi:hypothetical protein
VFVVGVLVVGAGAALGGRGCVSLTGFLPCPDSMSGLGHCAHFAVVLGL